MLHNNRWALVFAGALLVSQSAASPYADTVVSYTPGNTAQASLDNPASSLGAPSSVTVDPVFGNSPVDPFNPPYLASQIVSVGEGGSLTVRFNLPVRNHPANPFGLDFIIFGSAGFIITNGDYTGGGITDGTLFGSNPGETRIWVSADNATFYELNPAFAPTADHLFPTDGSGDFQTPVNPALASDDFAGQGLTGIRNLYGGSGGGTAYDLSWARDTLGQSVALTEVSYIRIDVLSGRAEIDALASVPEPATWGLLLAGGFLLTFHRHSRRAS